MKKGNTLLRFDRLNILREKFLERREVYLNVGMGRDSFRLYSNIYDDSWNSLLDGRPRKD